MINAEIDRHATAIRTVTRLSELQADDVKAVKDPRDTDLELTPYEQEMLSTAAGSVLLLYLRGTMIFGTSRVISRKNSEVEGRHALVVDLTDVVHLGVSAALALEAAILDMVQAGRSVYLVGAKGQPRQRLEKMGLLQLLPAEYVMDNRVRALEHAVHG